MVEVDDLDRKILREVVKDSKRSYRELARRLNVAVTTVINRIEKMEEMEIINGYTVRIDYEKLGYELTVLTEISVSKGKLLEMEKEIAKMPPVCAVYDVTGLTDAMVVAKFKNRKELSDFTKSLLSMPFIERTNTHVVLTTVKEDFRLLDSL